MLNTQKILCRHAMTNLVHAYVGRPILLMFPRVKQLPKCKYINNSGHYWLMNRIAAHGCVEISIGENKTQRFKPSVEIEEHYKVLFRNNFL